MQHDTERRLLKLNGDGWTEHTAQYLCPGMLLFVHKVPVSCGQDTRKPYCIDLLNHSSSSIETLLPYARFSHFPPHKQTASYIVSTAHTCIRAAYFNMQTTQPTLSISRPTYGYLGVATISLKVHEWTRNRCPAAIPTRTNSPRDPLGISWTSSTVDASWLELLATIQILTASK